MKFCIFSYDYFAFFDELEVQRRNVAASLSAYKSKTGYGDGDREREILRGIRVDLQ